MRLSDSVRLGSFQSNYCPPQKKSNEYDFWLDTIKNIRVYGEQREAPVSPFAKLEAIAMIYFPQFMTDLAELDVLSDPYELWMLEAAKKRIANRISELNDGFGDACRPYATKLDAIQNQMRTFAKQEFEIARHL